LETATPPGLLKLALNELPLALPAEPDPARVETLVLDARLGKEVAFVIGPKRTLSP
jgi:hypothetical protein